MNDAPTTINIIINEINFSRVDFIDIIFDLSTGPKTRRIGRIRTEKSDLTEVLGRKWSSLLKSEESFIITHFSSITGQISIYDSTKFGDIQSMSHIINKLHRPPTFNEWEKEKLMKDLQ